MRRPGAVTDPVVALVAERLAVEAEAEAAFLARDEGAEADAILTRAADRIRALDREIAATVATSPAGLIGQVRVLLELGGDGAYSDVEFARDGTCSKRLADTIIAGIERLAGGGPTGA
jgi:hypothetical protein